MGLRSSKRWSLPDLQWQTKLQRLRLVLLNVFVTVKSTWLTEEHWRHVGVKQLRQIRRERPLRLNGKPMKGHWTWGNVLSFAWTGLKSCSSVLYPLQTWQGGLAESSLKRITIIQERRDECMDRSLQVASKQDQLNFWQLPPLLQCGDEAVSEAAVRS